MNNWIIEFPNQNRSDTLIDTIINGDVLDVLKTLPDSFFDCCITSPPYYGPRDYGVEGQIGLEPSPEEYIDKLVAVFGEVHRVLKPEGTFWLNIGDSYCTNGVYMKKYVETHPEYEGLESRDHEKYPNKRKGFRGGKYKLKYKDRMMIPAKVAISLQEWGWYLRDEIIWAKPNCMPFPATDRTVSSHEMVYLLTKKPDYSFDYKAIQTEPSDSYRKDKRPKGVLRQRVNKKSKYPNEGQFKKQDNVGNPTYTGFNSRYEPVERVNKRSVWWISPIQLEEAHFAAFPPKLIEPMILAGCPEGGVVLDPFMGAGTTGMVAKRWGRHYVGIELNPEYIEIANNRIKNDLLKKEVHEWW